MWNRLDPEPDDWIGHLIYLIRMFGLAVFGAMAFLGAVGFLIGVLL